VIGLKESHSYFGSYNNPHYSNQEFVIFFFQGLLNGTEIYQDQSYLARCKISRYEQVSNSMMTIHSIKNLKNWGV